jgi:AraC-like DNA-binding protein
MKSVELSPAPPLRPYVRSIWCLELDAGEALGFRERIAPDGVVEVVLHFRDPMALQFAGEGLATQPRSSLVTLTRRFIEISSRGPVGFVAVRFHPWGAHPFLRVPVSRLADGQVDAADVWGSASRDLEERLALATGTRRRVALVEAFLLRQLSSDRHSTSEGRGLVGRRSLEAVVREIQGRRGNVRVSELCSATGIGERTLERAFTAAVGMPPSSYIRLVRFLAACSTLRRGEWVTLTRLAHDCGYYDQSHFIADVRAFAGMTPRDLSCARDFSFLEPG